MLGGIGTIGDEKKPPGKGGEKRQRRIGGTEDAAGEMLGELSTFSQR